jgi:LacI family transcriptional regulator
MLGVVVPVLNDIVMGILVTEIEQTARDLGYLATVVATRDDPNVRSTAIDRLLSRRVDGLILCDSEVGREVPRQAVDHGTPFVFAMRACDGHPSYTADDRLGGALVAAHFLEAGHRRVAVVPGPANARSAIDRVAGFTDAISEASDAQVVPAAAAGGFGVEDGYRFVTAVLKRRTRPTALFCSNDHAAIGAAKAVTDAGLRVGHDIALVGYNDIPQVAYLETPISSVRTDLARMGGTATTKLVEMIDGGTVESQMTTPVLVARESSMPSARAAGSTDAGRSVT